MTESSDGNRSVWQRIKRAFEPHRCDVTGCPLCDTGPFRHDVGDALDTLARIERCDQEDSDR
jgi:hypothetical protein